MRLKQPPYASALHSYDSETVVGILADSLESGEGVGVNQRLECLCLFADVLLFLARLGDDFFKFASLVFQDMLIVGKFLLCSGDVGLFLLLCLSPRVADVLLSEFYLKAFELFLFFRGKRIRGCCARCLSARHISVS